MKLQLPYKIIMQRFNSDCDEDDILSTKKAREILVYRYRMYNNNASNIFREMQKLELIKFLSPRVLKILYKGKAFISSDYK